MVSKRKQKRSPQKAAHNEDIYLNDLQVEIKQEEELIIEDADQQNVTWCFIGIDDDAEEDGGDGNYEEFQQQMYFQSQCDNGNLSNSINISNEEIIEISDDDDVDDYYDDGDRTNGNINCVVAVTNEPINDSFRSSNGYKEQSAPIEAADRDEETCSDDITESAQGCNDVAPKCEMQIIPNEHHSNTNNDNANMDSLNVGIGNEWMYRKLMKMVCHICGTNFHHKIYTWLNHMKLLHPKFLHEAATKYVMRSDNIANCKRCKMDVAPKVNHLFHYIARHLETNIFICAFCSYSGCSVQSLQKHQLETHPSVLNRREECPKCNESFKDSLTLEYHFMSMHSREFNTRYVYKCHLCDQMPADGSKNKFYTHLITQHKLNSWKSLNFRKIDNGQHMMCSKCHRIFVKCTVQQLLAHYLTHEDKSSWSCKFCKSCYHFTDWSVAHLCTAMREYYAASKVKTSEIGKVTYGEECKDSIQKQQHPVNWEEFEGYIEHICPFCNEGFDRFEEWRLHVRELHHIHTLEGLNMTIIPEDSEKLLCLQCYSSVTKSAVELHKHRFQHLPNKPYKCRHCVKSIATYNMALAHVQNRCQDDTDFKVALTEGGTICNRTTDAAARIISIICTLCNNKRFATFSQLANHINSVHDNFKKYFTKSSKDCGRVCKICQANMKRDKNKDLICHYLQHLHERPFKCIKCTRSYPTYRIALSHAKSYHVDTTTDIQLPDIKQESEKKPSCFEVQQKFKMSIAEKKAESVDDKAMPNAEEKVKTLALVTNSSPIVYNYVQIVPPESNPSRKAEDNHGVYKSYEKFIKYACPECNELFNCRDSWQLHISSKHTFFEGNNLHIVKYMNKGKCTDCNSVILFSLSKKEAHKLIHMPYRSVICALCSERFTLVSALYRHVRKVHFVKGSFKCPLCAQVLTTDYERLEHLHKMHPCTEWPSNLCGKCGNIVDDLNNHLLKHHLAHDRNYRCEHCGIHYEFLTELESHIAKVHRRTKDRKAIATENQSETILVNQVGKRKLRSMSPVGKGCSTKKPCALPTLRNKRK